MLAALLLALQADAPAAAAEAIWKTQSEKSFEVAFEGSGTLAGARIEKKGTGRRCAPGVILLEIETTGNQKTLAIRVVGQAWVYAEVSGCWVAHDQSHAVGVAHGVLNPERLLALLAEYAPGAKAKGTDLEIQVGGAEAVALAGTVVPNQGWKRAQATVVLVRDGAGRCSSIRIKATVANAEGAGDLTATIAFRRYGEVALPDGLGGAKFDKTIRSALDEHYR